MTAPTTPCATCEGCGKVANSPDAEPWTAWASLPCPACGGAGKVTAVEAVTALTPPADALAPDAPAVWRVGCEGVVHSVRVWTVGDGLYAASATSHAHAWDAAAHDARGVVLATARRERWPVAEVLAPGVASRAEALDALRAELTAPLPDAELAAIGARAAAVAAEALDITLTPWLLEDDGDDHVIVSAEACAEIARLPHSEGAEIDAAFIVRAVNGAATLAADTATLLAHAARLTAHVAGEPARVAAAVAGETARCAAALRVRQEECYSAARRTLAHEAWMVEGAAMGRAIDALADAPDAGGGE